MAKSTRLVTSRQVPTSYQPQSTAYAKVDEALSDYRDLCDGLDNLDDARMTDILEGIPGQGEKVEDARIDALKEANDTAPGTGSDVSSISIMDEQKAASMEVGSLFSKEMNQYFLETADKKEDVDGAPLAMAFFVDKTPALAKVLDDPEHPLPGTRHDADPDEDKYPGNIEPDYYKHSTVGGKFVTGSVYSDEFAGSVAGRAINEVRLILSRYKKNESLLPDDRSKWDALPNENSWDDLSKEKKMASCVQRWNNRFNNSVARYRTMQAFRLQRARIENYSHLSVGYVDDNVAVASRKKSPILIQYLPAGQKIAELSDPMSIGTFNRLRVKVAAIEANKEKKLLDISHLKATVAKTPRDTTSKIPAHPTTEQMLAVIVAQTNYLDRKRDGYTKRVADLVAKLNKTDSDDDVENLGDAFYSVQDDIMPLFNKRYDAIKERKRAEQEAASANDKAERAKALRKTG